MATALKIPTPEGITLDTSRVGGYLDNIEDARVGETIRFYYSGGSEDGERNVLVQKVSEVSETVEGITLERQGEYRRYSDSRATDIWVVEPFVVAPQVSKPAAGARRVRFDNALEEIAQRLSAEELAQLFAKHVVGNDNSTVVYDGNTGEVVVTPKAPVVAVDYNGRIMQIEHNGKRVKLYLYIGDKIGVNYQEGGKTVKDSVGATPELLLECLQKVLS